MLVLPGGSHASSTLYTRSFRQGSAPPSPRDSFTMAVGLDVNISPHFAIRAVQVDWFYSMFPNGVTDHQDNFRFTSGIVFRWRK